MSENSEVSIYNFAGFSVDVTRRQLLNDSRAVPITAKAFDTLLVLISQRGATVSKSDLMSAVWPDTAVEENNLTQQISALRRALGERPDDHRFIVTVPGRGYCLVADVGKGGVEREVRKTEPQTKIEERLSWFARLDPAAARGYILAISLIALVGLGFVWSVVRDLGSGRPQSLAVLTFKVSSTGDEYIGEGISETLRARLGSVQDLVVRPDRAFSSEQDALAVGRRLNVDTVVTGSVQRDHDRLRVAVEMLDVTGGRIIWGKTFDDSASNLFALQDSIAGEVAHQLNIGFVSQLHPRNQLLRAATGLPKMLEEIPYLLTRKPETASV